MLLSILRRLTCSDLHPVIHDNLRPPDPAPSMHTKGRKSSTKKCVSQGESWLTIRKVKETGEVDEDGNPIQLSDVEKEGDGGVGDEGLVEARIQSPKEEIKEELKELPTPKRKRATKPKGNAAKVEEDPMAAEAVDVKPEVEEQAVNGSTDLPEQPEPAVSGKAPPKKRARKSKDAIEA